MSSFSKRSQERLETCHPAIQILFEKVVKVFDCTVLCGHRGKDEQNDLFNSIPPKTRCKWPDSTHNTLPSTAVDVAPYYVEKPHVRWDEESLRRWYYFGGLVIGIADMRGIPIRWGGDWDRDTYILDQNFNDLPHFELVMN